MEKLVVLVSSRECWIFLFAFGANDDRSTHFINYRDQHLLGFSGMGKQKNCFLCLKKKNPSKTCSIFFFFWAKL